MNNNSGIIIKHDYEIRNRFKKDNINKRYESGKIGLRAECEKFEQVVCVDEFELISVNIDELFDNYEKIGC